LFVDFAGAKHPKQVGKCQKFKKFNLEVVTTFFEKFCQNPQILKSLVSISNFKPRVSVLDFWWSLDLEVLARSQSRRLRSRLHHCCQTE